jgi:hypothetical protein
MLGPESAAGTGAATRSAGCGPRPGRGRDSTGNAGSRNSPERARVARRRCRWWRWIGGGGGGTADRIVIGGVYNVALIVDGKTVDTKPLRVNDDPDVLLTSANARRTSTSRWNCTRCSRASRTSGAAHGSAHAPMSELSTAIAGRSDIPADVKASFDAFNKELTALAPKVALPQGGRGGGGGGRGNNESLSGKLGQAKNGYMGGMTPGDQTVRAYTEVKAQTPKAIADLNALIAKAATLSSSLAKYNLTLTVPEPVKALETAPARKASNGR